jgi:hypothetical protein
MDVNLGDGMSSVIPSYDIVRAENACAEPFIIRAPPFAFAHDPFDLQNAQRSTWEPGSRRRRSQVIIDIPNGAEAIVERFGNGATEPFPTSRRLDPTDRSDHGRADFRKWNRSHISTIFGPHTKRPHHLRLASDKLSH